jgi:hypothetical protein
MAKPIPQLKRPSIPADIAERFIAAGPNAAVVPLVAPPSALSIVPEPPIAPNVNLETEAQPEAQTPVPAPLEVAAPAVQPVVETKTPRSRPSKSGRLLTKRATGAETRKVTFYLPPELDQELGLHCVRHGLDRSEVIVFALRKALNRG